MNILRNLLRPKVIIGGLIASFIIAMGTITAPNLASASACPGKDDDTNAFIRCGFNNLNEFESKFNQNPNGDLQHVYKYFGMGTMSDFKARAFHVTIYKNGEVRSTNTNELLGTNAVSSGREKGNGANRTSYNVPGSPRNPYWQSPVQDNFGRNSLGAYAVLNDDHSLGFTVMEACGNPVIITSPGFKCQMLKQTKVSDTEYKYLATPFTKNGATLSKIVYDFGDGESKTVTSNFTQEVSYTYVKTGKFTARATVFVMVNGVEKQDTRDVCTKPVDIPEKPKPIFACTGLVAQQVPGSRTKFTFTGTAKAENGAVLQSGTFKFDDGKTATVNAVNKTVITTYEYVKVGNHTTTLDLTFNVGKDEGNVKCKVVTKTTPPTCADTPDAPECKQPTCEELNNCAPECTDKGGCEEIPSTGPAEVLGSVLGLSAITGAGVYYRNSRRDWLNNLLNR